MLFHSKMKYIESVYLIVVCGVILILSAVLKSVNIHSFAMETGNFIDMYMPSWLHGFQYPCAMIVCQVELMLGLLVLRIKYRQVALCGMLALMTFFVWLTAVNAFFPTILGSIESCGCFGELIHFTPMASFVKSVVLWAIVGSVLLVGWKQRGFVLETVGLKNSSGCWKDSYLWISVCAGWCLVLFSYFFVNKLNHSLYIVFYVGICLILTMVIIWCWKNEK